MIFLTILETVLFLTITLFFFTQLVGPVISGTPVMPILRRLNARLEKRLETAKESLEQQELAEEIAKHEAELASRRQQTETHPKDN